MCNVKCWEEQIIFYREGFLFFYFLYLNQNYKSKYETNNANMGKQMYKSQYNRTFSKKGMEKDNSSKNTKKRYQKYTVFSYMNILSFFSILL